MAFLLSRDLWRELENFWAEDTVTSLRRLGVAVGHAPPGIDRRFAICHVEPDEDPGGTRALRRVAG